MILLAALALSGCVSAGGSFCDINRPFRPTPAELAALSDAQVTEQLRINEIGQKLCGWRP